MLLLAGEAVSQEGLQAIYPLVSSSETFIKSPYLDDSFLQFLKASSVYPVFDKDGLPLFYYSENESFGCTDICDSIDINNYTMGSKSYDLSSIPASANVIEESVVVGNPEIGQSMDSINSIRNALGDSPVALSDFESTLLEEQKGPLEKTYFDQRYDDVWDYAFEQLQQDQASYSHIKSQIGNGNMGEAVRGLEDYVKNNYDISSAYDMSNLYDALENKKLGQMQTKELMENLMQRMLDESGIKANADELLKSSELLNSPEFKDAFDKAADMMQNNPEAYDRLKDLAQKALENEAFRDQFKEAVKDILDRGDFESLKQLADLFSKMDNKEQLLKLMMDSFSSYMRQLAEDGKLDDIFDLLDNPQLKSMLNEAMKAFSQQLLSGLKEYLSKNIPAEFPYIIAIVSVIVAAVIFIKMKI